MLKDHRKIYWKWKLISPQFDKNTARTDLWFTAVYPEIIICPGSHTSLRTCFFFAKKINQGWWHDRHKHWAFAYFMWMNIWPKFWLNIYAFLWIIRMALPICMYMSKTVSVFRIPQWALISLIHMPNEIATLIQPNEVAILILSKLFVVISKHMYTKFHPTQPLLKSANRWWLKMLFCSRINAEPLHSSMLTPCRESPLCCIELQRRPHSTSAVSQTGAGQRWGP